MKVTEEMVTRFLQWRLPDDFHPDAGISFNPEYNVEYNASHGLPPARWRPTGTNLLHAGQAREMLEYVLGVDAAPMKNPHIVVGEGRRCLCGLYDGKPLYCEQILASLDAIRTLVVDCGR